jgi:DNA (cytosine-5)-methyltransferase 1
MNKNNKMITCYNMGQPSNEFEPYTQNGGVSPTLLSRMGTGGNQVPIVHCYDTQRRSDVCREVKGNISPTLLAACGTGGGNVPMIQETYSMTTGGFMKAEKEKAQTLLSRDYKDAPIVNAKKTVRRLTPLECERLQGLPDGYTLINDSSCRDSARYKALGNGMAQPCADYIIRRIVEVSENE